MNPTTNNESGMPEKKWYTVPELREFNSTAIQYLWAPYFPRPSLCAITGPSDCGKSTILKQFALAIVTRQTEFLGLPLHAVHGRVCYVATEDEQTATWRVLHKQIQGSGMNPADDSLVFVFDPEQLEEYLKEKGDVLDAVIVDTLGDTLVGNPNNLIDVRNNLRKYSEIARKYNLCIVFVHHNVKNSEKSDADKNKMNGSQALEARLRCVLDLRLGRQNNERELTVVKCNHLPQDQKNVPHVLELHPEHLLFTYKGQAIATGASSGSRYDKELWVNRMARRRELKESFRTAIEYLKKELPGEDIPSETWFKENCKDMGGQPEPKIEGSPIETITTIEPIHKM